MNHRRLLPKILWILVIISPLVSILIMCAATSTSLFGLDAWNTTWNDENGYYCTVRQMRIDGVPTGMAGYNEVAAQRPSYGPYSPFVYIPYYLGSFVTGLTNHNYIYLINIVLSLIATAAFVVLARPNPLSSALVACFFVFQFIITRYVASGMTEASYLVFAAVLAGCLVWLSHAMKSRDSNELDTARSSIVFVFLLLICAICFWGMMRPYLLAFIVIPCALLLTNGFGLSRKVSYTLFAFAALLSIVTLLGYLYFSKYYVTPYFYSASIANSIQQRIASAAESFIPTNIAAIANSAKLLLRFEWGGIMAFMFAALWISLLVLAVKAFRKHDRARGALIASALFAGFLVYEANILLYSYTQLHRTLIATDVFFMLLVLCLFLGADSKHKHLKFARIALTGVISALCIVCLAVHTDEFALPQTDVQMNSAQAEAQATELEGIIEKSEDPWDNTVAHPVESDYITLYYVLPSYCSANCCQKDYLKTAVKTGTLRSKYLSLPDDYYLNKSARKRYEVVYENLGHVIYRVR